MKIFLDTNIFLRFFVPEDEKSHTSCVELLTTIESGVLFPYTSNIVISEYIYVITKTYRKDKNSAVKDVLSLLNLRNLTLIEKTQLKNALELYQIHNIKFGDCLIATQIPKGVILCTYDTDFSKIPFLNTQTPALILSQLKKPEYRFCFRNN